MSKKSLGIYVHIPFCRGKCSYCNFYSVSYGEIYYERYIERLSQEIRNWSSILDVYVDSIYFGGGTPSLIGAQRIINIIESIDKNFKLVDPEITIEVNPNDYSNLDFKKLSASGVNRISIGAQSLKEEELKILGRRHCINDIYFTLESVNKAGVKNISADFILGVPGQTVDSLEKIINFCGENNLFHVSAYLLKVEKGTYFFQNRSQYEFLSEDEYCNAYMYFSQSMREIGYNHYEISNFAISGFESRHNYKYWNCEDYLGLGPSAHSLIGKNRFYYPNSLEKFNLNKGYVLDEIRSSEEEYIMLQLRLSSGLTSEGYEMKFNKNIPAKYFEKAKIYESLDLVKCGKNYIKLTEKGFLLSNTIIGKILY